MKTKRPQTKNPSVRRALREAESGNRDAFLRAVQLVHIRTDKDATSDDLWLAAEAAYQAAKYEQAVDLFSRFEKHEQSNASPAWQRYLSSHRRSFASLKLGKMHKALQSLIEAEQRMKAAPELASREADVEAMCFGSA